MTHLGPSLRRAKVRERPFRRVLAAVVVSLLVNAALFLLLVRAGAFQMGAPAQVKRVALAPISPSQWAANRAIAGAQPERRPAEPFAMPRPPPPEPEDKPKGQIVDLGPTNGEKPKDARFLAEHDSKVEKETRSRHARAGYERALPTPQAPGTPSAAPPGERGRADRSVPGLEGTGAERERERERKVAVAKPLPEAGDGPGTRAPDTTAPAPAPAPAPAGQGEGGQRRAGEPGTNPLIAPGTLARIAGGPAPDDLEGIEEGEATILNAKSFKYASYFNRIHQAVARTWDPNTPLRERDPDGTMFAYKDRYTVLNVTLDDAGHLKAVAVARTSGVDFLDRSAILAFRKAEPFVNPPRGIVDGDGEIKFFFGFHLEVGRSGLSIFRAPNLDR